MPKIYQLVKHMGKVSSHKIIANCDFSNNILNQSLLLINAHDPCYHNFWIQILSQGIEDNS